jgi:tetratricopeptide (TPR) repeat protein
MSTVPKPGDKVGHYTVVGELGRGGMALVLDVKDDETGESRALKILLPGRGTEAMARRFRGEYRALSRLDHPGVLRVFDGGDLEGQPWFAMERIEGQMLKDVAQDWRTLPPTERFRRARKVLIELARALEYIHSRGLVHRDVTPSNIMMQPDGSVKLMDFGVVKDPGQDLTTVGEVVGTVAYIAPEQISGGPVDERADLYSVGAVFYLLLTGRRPFNARTLAGYMEKHLNRPVRPPRELVPTIPGLADEVCVRLMAKKPADRFASATHLLHVLHASVPPGPPPGTPGWAPLLVGRSAEVAHLRGVLARLAGGRVEEGEAPGGVLLVEGVDGMGRNRLAAEASTIARRHGLRVSRSRAQAPDQRAYSTYRPVFEDLVRETREAPAPALVATFGDGSAGDERVERYAVMSSLAGMLARSGPRVLILHELQRSDRGSIELTEYLVRNLVGTKGLPLLFVITRPAMEDGEDDPLQPLLDGSSTQVPAERISLDGLSAAAVEELLLGVCADSPLVRTLSRRMHQEASGNPFLVAEMIRYLFESGHLRPREGGQRARLRLDAQELSELTFPIPSSLREVLRERMEPLSAEARLAAQALAISREQLDVELLLLMTGLPEPRLLDALDELLEARIVDERRSQDREMFALVRNRVRDVVLDVVSQTRRETWHHQLADALELRYRRSSTAIVELLAWHYERGAHPAKACPYLIDAGRKLVKRGFVAEALESLDRALELEPAARHFLPLDAADRRLTELRLERAQALAHLGRWEDADDNARQADALARDLGDRRLEARTATRLALQARRRQSDAEALHHLRRALEAAQALGDKHLQIVPLYEFGAIQWSKGDLDAARDYFVQALASSEAYQDERSLALGENGLGLIALCRGQSTEARRHFEKSVAVCEKHGIVDRLVVSRINLVEVHHLTGNLRKGLELADRTVAHAQEVDHRYGVALGLRYRALTMTDIGRLSEAAENGRKALRIQRELGNPEDIFGTLTVLARAHLAAKDRAAAAECIDQALAIADEANDSEGFLPLIHVWKARLAAIDGEELAARACIAQAHRVQGRQYPHQQVRFKLNLARVYESLGEPDKAVGLAEEALRTADSCGFRFYALRARQIAARVTEAEPARGRHARVANALARSLAASLPRDDAEMFLLHQGIRPRTRARPTPISLPRVDPKGGGKL